MIFMLVKLNKVNYNECDSILNIVVWVWELFIWFWINGSLSGIFILEWWLIFFRVIIIFFIDW